MVIRSLNSIASKELAGCLIIQWEYEFSGLERWNGTVEWSTGLDYWSATPTILARSFLAALIIVCPIQWSQNQLQNWHKAKLS